MHQSVHQSVQHVVRALLALLVAIAALVLTAGTASAGAAAEEAVQGKLVNAGAPVPGAKIVVTKDGAPVGEATTGGDGAWKVPLPGPGSYTVTLDEGSLGEDNKVQEGSRSTLTVTVNSGVARTVLFPLGKSTAKTTTALSRVPQLALEGLQFGLIIALAAVGLSLIYGTTGLVNFAHGELITVGALAAFFLNVNLKLPFIAAAALAVVVAAVLGGAQDRLLWRPLRTRGTGLIAMLVVTIGLALLARYLFLFFFGGSSRPYNSYAAQPGIDFGPVSLPPKAFVSMGIAVVVLAAVGFALLRTRLGKATRAVSDNPALAASSGIDVERVIQVVWIAGAACAGLAGILLGLAQQVTFQMGFQILLLVFAAVTLGGLGTAFGALVGSLVVGIFTQVSTVVIPPELKNAGALAVLILIMLFRPQGILGRAERVG